MISSAVLLTPEEMGQADRMTISGGVPGIELMERAGQAVARGAANMLTDTARISVLCGPGNNGGDGFIAARCLAASGHTVEVRLLKPPEVLKGDALEAFRRMDLPYSVVPQEEGGVTDLGDELSRAELIVDALFGAGLDRPLSGPALTLAQAVNRSCRPVLAVDLPSGVNGATGADLGGAVRARATVTFFRRKPGHLLNPGRALCGAVTVADIGIRADVLERIGAATFHNIPALWAAAWPQPDPLGHKYTRGHVVVFGGPMSATGAARLSAGAALRAGAGLVTLASPPDAMMVNACHLTAVMLRKVAGPQAVEALLSDRRLNAALIGPGHGGGENTRASVTAILEQKRATVLDADALTSFSSDADALFALVRDNPEPVLMTPHEGEFARLFPEIAGDKLARARQAAERSGAVVVLKGPDTVIAAPDGRAAINDNAPPFLATAGSGDVLAGIATGLLAQGVTGFEAACQAVWLHGEAGREAGPGLIAEDLAPALKAAIRALVDKMPGS
ncbi:bifunctional ADP-dependent NAD(P)H-hydrate dehydratase/NAD(P)H-hydrate epimerase [Labrenzia sp. 011]|nr:bifunctional ADP-dependent NAD(P)H-hydrate dehydratase/NAD(P)H-hydrate epimerase [Labrenzia sp. 011]